jgi:hypothetical protein
MPSHPRLAIALAAPLMLTGCFSSQTLIKVKADGSGTIEQTNLVSSQMLGMAAAMAKGIQSDDVKLKEQLKVSDLFSEERLKAQAADWGAGVRYISSEPLTQASMQGARAVYAFDRIDGLAMGKPSQRDQPAPPMVFSLKSPTPGTSLLTIDFPQPAGTAASGEETPGAPVNTQDLPPEAMAMMKSMLEGMRIGVDVEVDGRVVKTNAPASSGSRVTLLDLDFAALLADPKQLEVLQSLRPGTDFETIRRALKDIPGMKVPTETTVTVEFAR